MSRDVFSWRRIGEDHYNDYTLNTRMRRTAYSTIKHTRIFSPPLNRCLAPPKSTKNTNSLARRHCPQHLLHPPMSPGLVSTPLLMRYIALTLSCRILVTFNYCLFKNLDHSDPRATADFNELMRKMPTSFDLSARLSQNSSSRLPPALWKGQFRVLVGLNFQWKAVECEFLDSELVARSPHS